MTFSGESWLMLIGCKAINEGADVFNPYFNLSARGTEVATRKNVFPEGSK